MHKLKILYAKAMLRTFGKLFFEKSFVGNILRRHWARLLSKKVSKKANIHKGAIITGNGLGLEIEEYGAIGINCQVHSNLHIGKHTMMGPECIILGSNHKRTQQLNNDLPSKHIFFGYEVKPVYIGDYCWIGTRTIILSGAKIGNNCTIGAGSVVPGKEYPNNCLIAGNPAIIKKYYNK